MATQAISAGGRQAQRAAVRADWRTATARGVRRSIEIGGGVILLAAALFLAVALATYHQTDPSGSTAAGTEVHNWMGVPGSWAADTALTLFGPVSALIVPLLYVGARRLWRLAGEHDGAYDPSDERALHQRWWGPALLLVIAMMFFATVLSLVFTQPGGTLPASMGGFLGLVGAGAVHAGAAHLPSAFRGWATLVAALLCLAIGTALAGRVFAVDWRSLLAFRLTLPRRHRAEKAAGADSFTDSFAGAATLTAPERKRKAKQPTMLDPDASRRAPEISDPSSPTRLAQLPPKTRQGDLFDEYELPSLDLLTDPPPNNQPKLDKLALERNARLLETVLEDFNVKGEITAVRTGPVVTMYELEPAPGIKASRVIGLADDIARNMSAKSTRISSIPGRTVMGIELPNEDRQIVLLKELMGSETFQMHKGALPIILGKDIAGEPVIADLAAMPHLLVAGTTGSGKSVGLNCILLSLLYRFRPSECRLILIDPKVLELKSYDEIPHLLSPVVTEPAKAVRALKWAVEEMERRYRQMSEIGVRNLSGFNEKVRSSAAKGKPLGRRIQVGFDQDSGEELYEERQLDYATLPLIVIIVDELADLMITVGKEIEVLIQRLSQKSRAAGIHLIMATQRPSVDVITGVIKANLPTRISFAVTNRIDSRTILGEQGAEQLLGKGDMLFRPSSDPMRRVHGPFVSDEEVEMVAQACRSQGKPDYIDSVTEEPEDGSFGFEDLDATASDVPEERKYRQVCQLVFESQKASASWLQRQMGVGYNTASKWIERMEEDGFVGPANHVGRREIYRDKDGNAL
jgi:S-DNA-T family DNA segregation ATPase FtsK/SpoIIIE